MRADHIRIYKSVHTWTGIVSGMALFIAFYAGALTVFKEPIERWASPPAPAPAQQVPLDQVPQLIVRTIGDHPAVARGFTIHVRENEGIPARMAWDVRDPGAGDHDESSKRHFAATLDASGAASVGEVHPSRLGAFIDVLHRVVGLPFDNDPGRWFMGVVSALYAVALISGVVVLLPSLVKDFFALRVGRNLKRMWLDAHNVVGIVSLPFHIVMALSAVVFAFHDQIYDLQDRLVHEGKWSSAFQRPQTSAAPPPPPRDVGTMLPPAELLARTREIAPGLAPTMLQYQQVAGPRAVVRVWGKDTSAISPRAMGGFVALDPYSGKVLDSDYLPGRQNVPNLFISSFFALHMASFGNAAVQWMYFVLGLAGAWLFYSGNLLWIESRRKSARNAGANPVQRLDTRLMASATVGICLGSVCGISLMLVAAKWLHGRVGDLTGCLQLVYYGMFFAGVAWAFMRGAARAGIHLLWTAAVVTAAIPLTSAIGWLVPQTGAWAHGSAATLGVDAVAAALAACFAWMARATARRARTGRPDSVWAIEAARQPAPAPGQALSLDPHAR